MIRILVLVLGIHLCFKSAYSANIPGFGDVCDADKDFNMWNDKVKLSENDNDVSSLSYEAGITLYNEGVRRQGVGNHCCALNYYLRAINIYPVFPEACQNVALLFDNGCVDANNGSTLYKDASMARYFNQQSIDLAPTLDFKLGAVTNLINFEMKQPGGKAKSNLSRMIDQVGSPAMLCVSAVAVKSSFHYTQQP